MSTPNTQDEGKTAAQIWAEEAVQPTPLNDHSETPSPTPAPAPAPAPSPAAAPAPAPSPAPAPAPAGDDPYAGLHPTIAQRLRGLDGLEQRLRKSEGTLGNLNSTLKTVQDENAKLKTALEQRATTAASGGAAPTAAAVAAAAGKSEKWEALKAEFPEWAEAVEERLGTQAGQQQAPVDLDALRKQIGDELAGSLTTKLTEEISASIQAATEERLVNVAHRGWKDTVKTPAFTQWMQAQTPEVQALGSSPVAEDAIALLDGFKSWQATQPAPVDPARIAAERKQRLQDAATVARGGTSQAPIRSTDDMSAEELWAFEAAELDRKKRAQNAR
jgi:hypothetical protein